MANDADMLQHINYMQEYGKTGQKRYNGIFYEEFVPELQGSRGAEVYKEMANNDDVIGAVLFCVEMLMRQTDYSIEPGGSKEIDKKAAEFVKECMNDMQMTWANTISEILSFLEYGWSLHEIVYKVRKGNSRDPRLRSKYNDGLIGWRKLATRAQDTLYKWAYDDNDELIGMYQAPPPDCVPRFIPIEKCLHFITKSVKENPEGRSILRNAYRGWYFKKRIQEIEGIGIERDLAGYPVIMAPEDMDNLWDDNDEDAKKALAAAQIMVSKVRRDESEGMVLPGKWKFQLLSSGSARQFDTNKIIQRYDTRIAGTVLADFVMLGHEAVGSFALADSKTNMFSIAIGAFLDSICEVFNNQAIPRLIDLNAQHFKGIADYPKMIHSDVESPELTTISTLIKDMVGIGVLIPDESLEDYVRRMANLPDRIDGGGYYPPPNSQAHDHSKDKNKATKLRVSQENPDEDIADEAEAAEAKKMLNRP